MNRVAKILLIILVCQAGLIALVNMARRGGGEGESSSGEKLIPFTLNDINQITLENSDGERLVLAHKEGQWLLPDKNDFPISEDKFRDFTGKVFGASRGWPVGKTKIAAKQFKLVEDSFERKITFHQDDKTLGVLFLGTSPGLRQVHGRLSSEDLTYTIDMGTYEAATSPGDWMEKQLYRLTGDQVSEIRMPHFVLKGEGSEFKLADLGNAEEMNVGEANSLVTRLIQLPFEDVFGKEIPAVLGGHTPVLEYVVATQAGDHLTYDLFGPYEEEFYCLKISKYPYYFKVRKDLVEKISKTERGQLVVKNSEKTTDPSP